MNKYQARLYIKQRIEDFLLSFTNDIDFCDIVNNLADVHLSLKQIESAVLIEQNKNSFFLGAPSAMKEKGFGFEFIDGSLYIGEWQYSNYHGYGYLFNKHVCHYGHFLNGTYNDNKTITSNNPHYLM